MVVTSLGARVRVRDTILAWRVVVIDPGISVRVESHRRNKVGSRLQERVVWKYFEEHWQPYPQARYGRREPDNGY